MMEVNPKKSTVLIVGAGIGGIATAARLAKKGFQVTVVEKCEKSGGRCGQMTIEGHRFDTGSTLFMMPELYAETYADLGENMNDQLDIRRINPTYHLTFQDNSQLQLNSDLHEMMAQVETIEPGSFERLLHYLAEGRSHYELSLTNVICRDFRSLGEFILKILRRGAFVPAILIMKDSGPGFKSKWKEPRCTCKPGKVILIVWTFYAANWPGRCTAPGSNGSLTQSKGTGIFYEAHTRNAKTRRPGGE
jgi:hypothetical protein